MIFIIEIVVFCLYNFMNDSYEYAHALFKASVIIAAIYLFIIFIMWVWDLIVPLKTDEVLDSYDYSSRWGFVYKGLERAVPHKLF